jgi:hypothetical protein
MEIILTKDQAIFKELEVAPSDFHLGAKPDIDNSRISLRIAEKPFALNYYKLAKLNGSNLPAEIRELHRRLDLWVITHSVGISDGSKTATVGEFGYRVQFEENYNVQVLNLLPETRFIKKSVSGSLGFDVDVDAKGSAKIPDGELQLPSTGINLGYGGNGSIAVNAGLSIRLSYPTLSASISVVGKYSSYSEWAVAREDKPLVGDQLFTQVVGVEKGLRTIGFLTQVHVTVVRFGIFHSRRESGWIRMELTL